MWKGKTMPSTIKQNSGQRHNPWQSARLGRERRVNTHTHIRSVYTQRRRHSRRRVILLPLGSLNQRIKKICPQMLSINHSHARRYLCPFQPRTVGDVTLQVHTHIHIKSKVLQHCMITEPLHRQTHELGRAALSKGGYVALKQST